MKSIAKWKNVLLGLAAVLVLFSTLRFEKLDEVRARADVDAFDPQAFARDFWEQDLMNSLDEAVDLGTLMEMLEQNPSAAFDEHSNAVGIGNIRFFFVSGSGTLQQIGDNALTVSLEGKENLPSVKLATEYIFGNAVRDGSGKMNIQDFDNTMDFNKVSEALNAIVRTEVLPPLKAQAAPARSIRFTGAIEMNRSQVNLTELEVIPISIDFESNPDETAN
jgi:predicted lipoprotein